MVVHPEAAAVAASPSPGLQYRYGSMAGEFPEEEERPGIVHRLDKDTSGVLSPQKTRAAREMHAAQFGNGTVKV
jgi:23S rRNA pseudouridine1911/1915/1917 synthase